MPPRLAASTRDLAVAVGSASGCPQRRASKLAPYCTVSPNKDQRRPATSTALEVPLLPCALTRRALRAPPRISAVQGSGTSLAGEIRPGDCSFASKRRNVRSNCCSYLHQRCRLLPALVSLVNSLRTSRPPHPRPKAIFPKAPSGSRQGNCFIVHLLTRQYSAYDARPRGQDCCF